MSVNTDEPLGRWKLSKEISVADLVSIVGAFISLLYAYSTLDSRIVRVEEKVTTQSTRDQRQDDEANRTQARVDAQLSNINAKLDRLIERSLK